MGIVNIHHNVELRRWCRKENDKVTKKSNGAEKKTEEHKNLTVLNFNKKIIIDI